MSRVAESGSVMDGSRVSSAIHAPRYASWQRYRTGRTVSHRLITALLLTATMLVGLTVAAQQAEATTLWHCNGIPYASVCTRTTGTVTVLDRATGQNVTWGLNTSVGLMYWSWNFTPQLCGTHGDGYVWSVSWKKADGSAHWAVIGDTWLQTGADTEWGPYVVDQYGRMFNPDFQLIPPSGTQGYCNSAYWSFMSGRI